MTGPRPPGQGEGRPPGQKGGPQAKRSRLHRNRVSVAHSGDDVATGSRSDIGVYTGDVATAAATVVDLDAERRRRRPPRGPRADRTGDWWPAWALAAAASSFEAARSVKEWSR